MNRLVIADNPKAFKRWLACGEVWYRSSKGVCESWVLLEDPQWTDADGLYVAADKYAELEKGVADGGVLEFRTQQSCTHDREWIKPKHDYYSHEPHCYRVVPKDEFEYRFFVGQFVVCGPVIYGGSYGRVEYVVGQVEEVDKNQQPTRYHIPLKGHSLSCDVPNMHCRPWDVNEDANEGDLVVCWDRRWRNRKVIGYWDLDTSSIQQNVGSDDESFLDYEHYVPYHKDWFPLKPVHMMCASQVPKGRYFSSDAMDGSSYLALHKPEEGEWYKYHYKRGRRGRDAKLCNPSPNKEYYLSDRDGNPLV